MRAGDIAGQPEGPDNLSLVHQEVGSCFAFLGGITAW